MIVTKMIFLRKMTMFGAHIVKKCDPQKRLVRNFMINHKVPIVLVVLKGDNREAKGM